MLSRPMLRRILGPRRPRPAAPSRLCTEAASRALSDGRPATEPTTSETSPPTSEGDGQPSEPDVDAVAGQLRLDAAGRQRLHLLMLEYSELQLSGGRAAQHVPADEWHELMLCQSYSARRRYHNYLFKCEKAQENDRLAKLRRRAEHQERQRRADEAARAGEPQHLQYGLGHNTIFHRIPQQALNSMMDVRLFQAMRFGQPLVFDLGFERDMKRRENKNAASQLHLSFSLNRMARDPFDLHFTSWDASGEVSYFLQKLCPPLASPSFPLSLHQEDHLSVFPRDKLVYLTPHCMNDLETFDYDAIYIVGGLVDLGDAKPLTLAKAKREGIKMARLPLSKYLNLGPGFDPCLTLPAMMSILLELRARSPAAGSAASSAAAWQSALRHVPQRGLLSPEQLAEIAAKRSLRRARGEAVLLRQQRRWRRDAAAAAGAGAPHWRDEEMSGAAPQPARCHDPYLERRPPAAAAARPASRLHQLLAELAADDAAGQVAAPAAQEEAAAGGQSRRRREDAGAAAPTDVADKQQVADGDLFRRATTTQRGRRPAAAEE